MASLSDLRSYRMVVLAHLITRAGWRTHLCIYSPFLLLGAGEVADPSPSGRLALLNAAPN